MTKDAIACLILTSSLIAFGVGMAWLAAQVRTIGRMIASDRGHFNQRQAQADRELAMVKGTQTGLESMLIRLKHRQREEHAETEALAKGLVEAKVANADNARRAIEAQREGDRANRRIDRLYAKVEDAARAFVGE